MKKTISLGIVLLSVLVLSACSNSSSKKSASSSESKTAVSASSKSSVAHKLTSIKDDDSSKAQSSSQSTDSENHVSDSTSSAVVANSTNSASASNSSNSSSDTNTAVSAAQELVGHSYNIEPMLYDGENSDQAMDDNKAPQNLIHDYTILVRFDSASSATTKHLGTYNPSNSSSYSIKDNTISIADFNIPFTSDGNSISFGTWTSTDSDGHTITWKVNPDDGTAFN